jgi:hypothetical protein
MPKLVEGQRYRIQYFPAGTRRPYQMVAQYLGRNKNDKHHQFSLRPVAGTSILRDDQIISTMWTDENVQLPKKM